jgi:hypothetical protein
MKRNVSKVPVGIPEGKRPLRRCKFKWEDNITLDFKGSVIGGCGLDSSG